MTMDSNILSALISKFEQLTGIEHDNIQFYAWLVWLWWPLMVTVVILPSIILVLFYTSACIIHIIRIREQYKVDTLSAPNVNFAAKARYVVALLWDCHGWIWHGYEIVGLENIPERERALIVYYHGAIPIDYYYFLARYLIQRKTPMWCIAANFLFKTPGLRLFMEVILGTPGSVQQIASLLHADNIVVVAPGGIREAQFSNEYYNLIWNNRSGFAKAAIQGKAPIIPIFTQNVREAYRTCPFWPRIHRALYEWTKFPVMPIYGGFPVKLRTIVGKPIPYDEKATPEELAEKAANGVRELIERHQRRPGSIVSALLDRFR